MDFTSVVLIQIVVFFCVVLLLPTAKTYGSIKLSAITLLVIVGISWYLVPQQTAAISVSLWLLLILFPLLCLRQLQSLVAQNRYSLASKWASWIRWIIPSDGMGTYHHLLGGIALTQAGEIDRGEEILHRYQHPDRRLDRSAIALFYRSLNRWADYLEWVEGWLTPAQIVQEGGVVLAYYIRALGETGNRSRLLHAIGRWDSTSDRGQELLLLRLYALAFCGRTELVTELATAFPLLPTPEWQQFWIGTAELVAGNADAARAKLLDLQQYSTIVALQPDLAWRLTHPLPDATSLSQTDRELLARLEVASRQELQHRTTIPDRAHTPATTWLVWINIAMFAIGAILQLSPRWRGLNLLELGGLIAPLVLAGEWWRLFTANFLHAGILHLAMNMLGLSYLGKFVEYRLGTVRFIIAYLFTGIGAMAMVTYIDLLTQVPKITIGASGAIMGLLGIMGAIHFLGWQIGKATSAAREFRVVMFAVGWQLVFDLTNGHTSVVGHFSGLALGFVVGLPLVLSTSKK
jgi:rhomboid protease GluP